MLHADENLVNTLMLMKCWKTNIAFLFPLKKNYSNLTEKHMLELRERKMVSVQMTLAWVYASLFPSDGYVKERSWAPIPEDGHTTGLH